MNFLLSLSISLALGQILLPAAIAQTDVPAIFFNASVPKVQAAKEFSISCEVTGVSLDGKTYYMFEFLRTAGPFANIEYKRECNNMEDCFYIYSLVRLLL
jgi:hypothetical protein